MKTAEAIQVLRDLVFAVAEHTKAVNVAEHTKAVNSSRNTFAAQRRERTATLRAMEGLIGRPPTADETRALFD